MIPKPSATQRRISKKRHNAGLIPALTTKVVRLYLAFGTARSAVEQ